MYGELWTEPWTIDEPGSSLTHVLHELMHEMSRANGGFASPQALVDCMFQPESQLVQKFKAQKRAQQSVGEFLQYLLEVVDIL